MGSDEGLARGALPEWLWLLCGLVARAQEEGVGVTAIFADVQVPAVGVLTLALIEPAAYFLVGRTVGRS